MGSQITKIPSSAETNTLVSDIRWIAASRLRCDGMAFVLLLGLGRSLTMDGTKQLSLETELNGVSVEALLKSAGELFEDNDLDGFRQFEQILGDKAPSTVVRLFARYAPVDLTTRARGDMSR